jgi:S-methylmethionine-dependent homocysteine/selenocysteine methylase
MQAPRFLPHQTDRLFLTDGGIETWLMYKQGFELPHFCGFQFLDDAAGREALSHGMLCQLGHLEEGDADQLASQHRELARLYPHINVFGGCCGTDFVHVRKICEALRD